MQNTVIVIERPGMIERGVRTAGRVAGDVGHTLFDAYVPQDVGATPPDVKTMLGVHGAFWSTVPLAAGLFTQTPWLAAIGVAGMIGGIGYSIYHGCRS